MSLTRARDALRGSYVGPRAIAPGLVLACLQTDIFWTWPSRFDDSSYLFRRLAFVPLLDLLKYLETGHATQPLHNATGQKRKRKRNVVTTPM